MTAAQKGTRTKRRKQCPICGGRFKFTLNGDGTISLQSHVGPDEERYVGPERSQCLGVGMRVEQR